MAKRNKVHIKIDHPDFKADCILPEGKALTYLKRIKKNLVDNLSVVTRVLKPGEENIIALHTDGPMPIRITEQQMYDSAADYDVKMELKRRNNEN